MTLMTTITPGTGMSVTAATPSDWKTVGKTASITRRFEFPDYARTSAFLDRVNALSEETGLFPDLGFAATYVNVTIPDDPERDQFALRINEAYAEDAE